MGRKVLVSDLLDTVRHRGEWRATWSGDDELIDYLSDSTAALHDFILAVDPFHDTLLKMADVSITAGTAKYAFPDDLFKLYGVSAKDGSFPDGYVALEQLRWDERYADGYQDAGVKSACRWKKFGDSFLLEPTPNWSGTVRLEYAYAFAEITSTAQELDFDNSWHEWVVLDICIKMCAKEESDPTVFMAQKQEVEKRIAATLKAEEEISLIPKAGTSATTLAGMRREIRNRGKWTNEEITRNMLTSWINMSVDSLEDFIVAVSPMDSSMLALSDVAVVAGTGTYDLPSDIHTLFGVSVVDGSTDDGYTVLEKYRWDERYADGYANAGIPSACRWDRFGNQIRLQPIPSWSGTIRLEYAQSYATLSAPSDTLDFENSWNEWIILDCCVKCCARMGTDPAVFLKQQENLQQRIQAALKAEDMYTQIPRSTSNSLTLQDLRRSVRSRGQWARLDITDNSLNEWVNSSLRALVDMMANLDPLYFNKLSDISVVSGTRRYSLPSDLYRLTGVSVVNQSSGDGYSNLLRFNFDERYDYAIFTTEKLNARYCMIGDYIEFQPTPQWTDTVRLAYIAIPTLLSAPTDTFNFRNGWQEWVILDCCAKVAMSRGQDPQMYLAMKAETTDRLERSMIRDIAKPRMVVDQYRRWNQVRTITRW